MSAKARFILAVVILLLVMTAPVALTMAIALHELQGDERAAFLVMLNRWLPIGAMLGLLALLLAVNGLRLFFKQYVLGLSALAEKMRLMIEANRAYRIPPTGAPEIRALAEAANALADARDALQTDVEARIAAAKAATEEERNRLAALVADLPMPVLVCNLDGRILLYNNHARLQVKALVPDGHAGGGVIGLGRSIYGVFDHSLIGHALESLQHRLERAGSRPLAHFITTTRAGQLIRVQMAPVLSSAAAPDEAKEKEVQRSIAGYVLVMENITKQLESGTHCDRTVQALTDDTRAALTGIRASLQGLRGCVAIDEVEAIADAIEDEIQILAVRLNQSAQEYANTLIGRWPLEDMLGADLMTAVGRRIEKRLGLTAKIDDVADDLWVRVDSYSLTQAVTFLAAKLTESFAVRLVRLRLARAGRMARLELHWAGTAVSTETLLGWQLEPMTIAGETTPLTLRDVTDRHGGQLSCGRSAAIQQSFFRIEIPAAREQESSDGVALIQVESRPEFYDFDLFHRAGEDRTSDDMPLAALTYTVFDTETTGIEPSAGDEIIQIGAVRIVNGRLLRHENVDQLIDPQRPLRPESIPIHGITEEMVRGQPTIATVLPQFHRFCEGTVLVAHNAAFDMRFLQLKEEKLGLRFTHPVLDTLLLSAVIHPNQESHKLEAIAERLGIKIIGRHTALGDAIVTAEVFLRMLPLLAGMGIHTLGQARAAAEKTYYARVKY
ncbi:exonuclease domain-containing protein [Sulfuricystis multivorans]|uniref:exonuclease domain-containing protein n=1 Tax=Sulfuricystis multivorans TaxID=2211108 RepID=UPI000F846778|nr:exonuclease domain-containing protein [Sulfuricystis multivorans]